MTRPPDANLPPQSAQWGRSVEDRLSQLQLEAALNAQDVNNTLLQLNSSVQLLARQVSQLNNAVETKFGSESLNGASFSTPVTGYEGPELEFVRPSWATQATVFATGTLGIQAEWSGRFGPQSNIVIDGVSNLGALGDFIVPLRLQGVNGALPPVADGTFSLLKIQSRADAFARTFAFSGSTLRVKYTHNILQTMDATSFFDVRLNATVFWSAS